MRPLAKMDSGSAPASRDIIRFRLYIAGQSPNSTFALANLQAICHELFGEGQYELDVVDLLLDPLRAVEDRILMTPTLVRLPLPSFQIVGDLSERERVTLMLSQFRGSK